MNSMIYFTESNNSKSKKKPKPLNIPLFSTNDNKDDIPKVIGQGTYGCVHKPSLKCKSRKKNYKNKISKYLLTKYADTEMKEYNKINKVDPEKNFFLGKPTKCLPDDNNKTKQAIKPCNFNKDIEHFSLLVMNDGGEDLEQFATRFAKLPVTNENIKKMELFWIEAQRILLGLTVFQEKGVVHNDLKAQNIVYNEELNRMNFIDFGMMTTKNNIIKKSKKSIYIYGILHWSYPFETQFLNYDEYRDFAILSDNEKNRLYFQPILKSLNKGESSDYKTFFSTVFEHLKGDIKLKAIQNFMDDYQDFLFDEIKIEKYTHNINKCVDTFDVYGTGLAFIRVLAKTYKFIKFDFSNDLSEIFTYMLTPHLPSRFDATEALFKFESVLEKHGILKKHNKFFENHILKDGLDKTPEIKINLTKDDIKLSPFELATLHLPPPIICPNGKEENPFTRKCVKKCKEGKSRNINFRCIKNKTKKIKS